MSTWIPISWSDIPRLLLQAAALFVVATFIFDAIHYALHCCLNSRGAGFGDSPARTRPITISATTSSSITRKESYRTWCCT